MLILQKEEAPEDIQGLARGVSLMRGSSWEPRSIVKSDSLCSMGAGLLCAYVNQRLTVGLRQGDSGWWLPSGVV